MILARSGSAPAELAARATQRANDGTPLYVHLPFCAAKCHYCDFFSVAAEGQDRAAMVAAILDEARARAPWHPRTLFLGGGTPSLLSVPELERLLDGLQELTGFRDSAAEVSVECNPESLDREKARALLDLGATRLSIGFQSLDDRVLALFGRVHDAAQSFRAFEAARAAGCTNLNVDLIYAVPDQELGTWSADLERVLALGPEHLSAYNLTFEEETLFRRWLDEGRLARQSEERELAFFEHTRSALAQRGYEAYEISNFASNGQQCIHNLNYWHNGEYVGIGPSAVSKVGATRAGNLKGIAAYTQRIAAGSGALAWEETPGPGQRLAETWWLGLRLSEGLSAHEARERAAFAAAPDPAEELARELCESGLLEVRAQRYRLTERGLPLADHVAKRFLHAALD